MQGAQVPTQGARQAVQLIEVIAVQHCECKECPGIVHFFVIFLTLGVETRAFTLRPFPQSFCTVRQSCSKSPGVDWNLKSSCLSAFQSAAIISVHQPTWLNCTRVKGGNGTRCVMRMKAPHSHSSPGNRAAKPLPWAVPVSSLSSPPLQITQLLPPYTGRINQISQVSMQYKLQRGKKRNNLMHGRGSRRGMSTIVCDYGSHHNLIAIFI